MKILVIRRDNIGDLVCTTPLIRALRRQLPEARIEALATVYNKAVLHDNPDIDALHHYTKAKHRAEGESLLAIHGRRLATILKLRRQHFDLVLLPGRSSASAMRFARWVAPHRILVQDDSDQAAGQHEVEQCCHLLARMGLDYETPAPIVVPNKGEQTRIEAALGESRPGPLIGLHISARKPSQRWSADRFATLARLLLQRHPDARFMLLWAPGSQDNPRHPGDDEKALAVQAAGAGLPIHPVATHRLEELIAALSLCDALVCGDGGAMHLAAGLGKPIVALFGQSDAARWHPWGVPHVVLQKPSQDVADIDVDEVAEALEGLPGWRQRRDEK